jgi:FKBP-type peptidyl-prolyl cis-trans isomerase (trigger factor)
MVLKRGIKLLDEIAGQGEPAATGDRVVFNLKIFLNRGDEVPLNERQAERVPGHMLRSVEDDVLIDHSITLGKRQAIAGVEHALVGMRVSGYRKVRVSPHLAYREQGIPGLIPKNALLVIELWLRDIIVAP